ncbi:hypothetical protein SSPO_004350 [Streptomyces antimycoticus]|uniref:Uncharacterized protein n=1 Tax=Streptomyces antimycoticus TaxID=68175 RepID=A0A499UV02_9ACTN|nr:hypothetical protein SSPO_004350 [Streptomyces antimycoticus]
MARTRDKDKASGTNLIITEVGADFSLRKPLGVFCDSRSVPPDNGRSAAPTFDTDGGVRLGEFSRSRRLMIKHPPAWMMYRHPQLLPEGELGLYEVVEVLAGEPRVWLMVCMGGECGTSCSR